MKLIFAPNSSPKIVLSSSKLVFQSLFPKKPPRIFLDAFKRDFSIAMEEKSIIVMYGSSIVGFMKDYFNPDSEKFLLNLLRLLQFHPTFPKFCLIWH